MAKRRRKKSRGISPWLLKILIEDAQRELDGVPEDAINLLSEVLSAVFETWKREHGELPVRRGRLPLDFESAEPWHCAGPAVSNRVDLAVKLLNDEYRPFLEVSNKAGLSRVLALLILQDCGMACESAFTLVVASDFTLVAYKLLRDAREERLLRLQTDKVFQVITDKVSQVIKRVFEEVKPEIYKVKPALAAYQEQRKILAEGRKKGAAVNKEKSEEFKERVTRMTKDCLKHPASCRWTTGQIADHIFKTAKAWPGGKIRSKSYIEKLVRQAIKIATHDPQA